MLIHLDGLQLKLEFCKTQFLAPYPSLFTLLICHKDCVVIENRLLMTFHFSQQSLTMCSNPNEDLMIIRHHKASSNLMKTSLKITQWAYQRKMLFNSDITKQAQEIVSFLERKMIQVFQVYTLIMHEYINNVFKNILVFFK